VSKDKGQLDIQFVQWKTLSVNVNELLRFEVNTTMEVRVSILLATSVLDGLLNYSSTLKMEAIRSSETSGATQRTTRRHIPEDDTLQNHRCENLKSYNDELDHF
jgi:hypothetical protein